ncbi:transcriptional regulator, CopG family [Thermosyntropha lipolytica DSM 11003]|uniref:Transcriptional regulator, CopG family n=1 Tax=Thermosyntropha lipolytica DSM 11003 TaxID=1123382 RepID=A0A1M5JF84_9FIRM|nr:ribbon-helix-helix protein, CopG family [Thermosyntropha lipolytica]SHG39256.1 transcriptional regulator, CopG family [Thermosyntropha lipolytica DSM 11003]
MPASKRIIITVPENLLSEVDDIMLADSKTRSEIIRDAIQFYLGERKKVLMREKMRKGYMEMAEINLRLAYENVGVEDEVMKKRVEKSVE